MTKEEAINYLSKCRERAQDCVDDFERDFPRKKSAWRRDVEVYDMAIAALNGQPVVRGRWEYFEDGLLDLWRCTSCGDEWTFEYDPTNADTRVNCCPNCGARMEDT